MLELEGDRALIPESTSRLQTILESVEGERIWSGEARPVADARRPAVMVSAEVPAARLAGGDYLLTLSAGPPGEGTLYRYFVRVLR